MLDQPQYTATEVAGLQRCFVLYVGMPKSRWSDIKKAEEDTPEGNIMFERLKEEYKRDYMINTSNVPDLEYGLDD
jgi:hypothetical protein